MGREETRLREDEVRVELRTRFELGGSRVVTRKINGSSSLGNGVMGGRLRAAGHAGRRL